MFITFAGRKQTGKTESTLYLAKQLIQIGKTVKRINFADKLKQACSIIFNIPLEDMETEEGKNKLTKIRRPYLTCDGVYCASDLDDIGQPFMTIREILQFVGTNLFREQMYGHIWIDSVFHDPDLQKYDYVLIRDDRFKNEVSIANQYGKVFLIERDTGLQLDNHKSETELALIPRQDFSGIIDNNSDFPHLWTQLHKILDEN